jgi:ribonuclease P protein component
VDVQKRGRKVQSDHFFLLFVSQPVIRIGITVSSKVGNAVVRNRLKRWVREYVRAHRPELAPGEQVVIAKTSAAASTHAIIDADLRRLFGRAKVMR